MNKIEDLYNSCKGFIISIYLTGSRAYKTQRAESDLDIIIICRDRGGIKAVRDYLQSHRYLGIDCIRITCRANMGVNLHTMLDKYNVLLMGEDVLNYFDVTSSINKIETCKYIRRYIKQLGANDKRWYLVFLVVYIMYYNTYDLSSDVLDAVIDIKNGQYSVDLLTQNLYNMLSKIEGDLCER